MLFKNQSSQYEFKQGISFFIIGRHPIAAIKKRNHGNQFSTPQKTGVNKNWLAAIIVLVPSVALGLLFYTLRNKKNGSGKTSCPATGKPSFKPDTLASALVQKERQWLPFPPKTDSFLSR